jgi:hypothetical protein
VKRLIPILLPTLVALFTLGLLATYQRSPVLRSRLAALRHLEADELPIPEPVERT